MDDRANRSGWGVCTSWVCGLCLALMLFMGTATAAGQGEVDAAGKKLMAAGGLFDRGLYDLAQLEYAEFLKEYPNHAETSAARYGLAICVYKQNRYEEAAKDLAVLVEQPALAQREEALAVLSHCYQATNNNDKALTAMDRLLKDFPQSGHAELASINRVQVLYLLDRKAEAIEGGKAFVARYPKSGRVPTALYFTAVSQVDTGKLDDAEATLKELIRLEPDTQQTLDAILLLGQTYEAAGNTRGAEAQYQRLITNANSVRKAEGHYAIGVSLFKTKRYKESIERLRIVLKDYPQSEYAAPALLQLGLAQLASGDGRAARQTLETVSQKDKSRSATAQYWLAQADIGDKAFDRAYKTLDKLAQMTPPVDNLEAVLFDRACCLMAMEKFDQASGEFAGFREKFPASRQASDALYRQAFSLHKLAKYEQSLALSAAVPSSADAGIYASARELTAENHFLLKQYPKALPLYAELAQGADGQAASRFGYRLGQCAYFTGDYKKAAAALVPVASARDGADAALTRDAVFLLGDAYLQLGDYAAAEKSLTDYLATAPGEKLEAQYKLAVAQVRGNRGEQAAATLREVVRGPSDSPWVMRAHFELGQLEYQNKRYEPAAASLGKVIASKAGEDLKAPAAYLLAWIDFDSGRFVPASEAFAKMAGEYPTHALAPSAVYQRAVAVKEAGQPEKALELLNAFLKDHPGNENANNARYLVGTCQSQLGQHGEAVKTFTALAADTATRSDLVLYELAWAQRSLDDNAGAATTYRQLLKEYPAGARAAAAGAELAELLYTQGQYADAAKLLETAVADANADPATLAVAQYRLGWSYSKLGDQPKAAVAFSDFAARQPNHELAASALYQAGLAMVADNKADEAEKMFTTLSQKYPDSELAAVGLLKLGELAATKEDYAQSKLYYTQYFKGKTQEKFDYLAHFGLGWACENLKEYEEARRYYANVIKTHNGATAARAQFQIGETYFLEEDYARAVKELLAVDIVYAYPEWSAAALFEAGRAFEQLKEPAKAMAQYRQCISKYKDAPEAKLAEKRLKAIGG